MIGAIRAGGVSRNAVAGAPPFSKGEERSSVPKTWNPAPRTWLLWSVSLAIALTVALPAAAQRPGGGSRHGMGPKPGRPPFLRELFPPELVMRHQRDIELTAEQRTAITEAIKKTQGQVLEIQWQLEDEQQQLTNLLKAAHVDEQAALAQVERVMSAEQQLKKQHLTLLIRIKNQLTTAQQEKLAELRPHRPGQPPVR